MDLLNSPHVRRLTKAQRAVIATAVLCYVLFGFFPVWKTTEVRWSNSQWTWVPKDAEPHWERAFVLHRVTGRHNHEQRFDNDYDGTVETELAVGTFLLTWAAISAVGLASLWALGNRSTDRSAAAEDIEARVP